MINNGFRVTEEMDDVHPFWKERYPLMPGDLLQKDDDGTFFKEAPGLAVGGFILTPEQEANLEPVKFLRHGLDYQILEDE